MGLYEKSRCNQNHSFWGKRLLSLLCAAMLVSFTACSTNTDDSDEIEYVNTTVVGEVTAIQNSTVTIRLGELTENEYYPGEMPEMSGETPRDEQEAPPDKPEDGTDGKPENREAQSEGSAQDSENQQTPPQMPEGSFDAQKPDKPSSSKTFVGGETTICVDVSTASMVKDSETITIENITLGDILKITFDEEGKAKTVVVITLSQSEGGGKFFDGNVSSNVEQGDSASTISQNGTYSDTAYYSTGDDENALRIDGATVTLENITVEKNGGTTSNTENGDFYGINAALLATNGATVTINNAVISSSAQNGNGVFSYGNGTTVRISDSIITTTADNSGGIQTTGGGTTYADDLTISTAGNSSAAIRSDRGGGTVIVNGGSYTSNGYNSPAVYSTAAITVTDAVLTANNSEALVIEGKNSITLENCAVSGNMSDTKGASSDENVHNIMIYQSMSGDADVGTSEFSMTGGSLTSYNGDMFYVTNTACSIMLSEVNIVMNDAADDGENYFLNVCGNSASHGWGAAGANGAQVTFTAAKQTLCGNISVDSISTLQFILKDGSEFTGTITIRDNEENGTPVAGNAAISIGEGCTWNLTGDCTVSTLTNFGTIHYNGYTITLADGTVLQS